MVINSNNSCVDNSLSIPSRSTGASHAPSSSVGPIAASETHKADASLRSLCNRHTCRRLCATISAAACKSFPPFPAASSPHGSPRSSTVCSSLYPPAAVVILRRFSRRNSRIRQQYPRCHLLCRLQPHTDYFGFQRGMPPFAPFGIEFPRQCSFRLRHFQYHLFALVMHVFVEIAAGFPPEFSCLALFTVACHAAVPAHPHQEWMPRRIPPAQVVNAIGFAVNTMDKALFFREMVFVRQCAPCAGQTRPDATFCRYCHSCCTRCL